MSGDTQKIRFERAHGYKRSYRDSSSYQVMVQEWHLLQSHREDKMTIVRLQDLHLLHAILEDAARDLRFVHQELYGGPWRTPARRGRRLRRPYAPGGALRHA